MGLSDSLPVMVMPVGGNKFLEESQLDHSLNRFVQNIDSFRGSCSFKSHVFENAVVGRNTEPLPVGCGFLYSRAPKKGNEK